VLALLVLVLTLVLALDLSNFVNFLAGGAAVTFNVDVADCLRW